MERKTYEIITWAPDAKGEVRTTEWRTVYRIDVASREFYKQLYDALKANGLLDTQCAWRCVHDLDAILAKATCNGVSHAVEIAHDYRVEFTACYSS